MATDRRRTIEPLQPACHPGGGSVTRSARARASELPVEYIKTIFIYQRTGPRKKSCPFAPSIPQTWS